MVSDHMRISTVVSFWLNLPVFLFFLLTCSPLGVRHGTGIAD
jgi:hypothetical protein